MVLPSTAQGMGGFVSKATRGREYYPAFDKWYRKVHKLFFPAERICYR